jgi:Fe-S-cluster containining protein
MLFRKTGPCAFLGKDNRCTIWKDRPEVCRVFPYAASMFMSRVYIAISNEEADIIELLGYMDDSWPCTKVIKADISERIEKAKAARNP